MGIFIIENILIMINARIISSSNFEERFDMNVGYVTRKYNYIVCNMLEIMH